MIFITIDGDARPGYSGNRQPMQVVGVQLCGEGARSRPPPSDELHLLLLPQYEHAIAIQSLLSGHVAPNSTRKASCSVLYTSYLLAKHNGAIQAPTAQEP